MSSSDDRNRIAQEYVDALVMEGIGTEKGMALLLCVSKVLALESTLEFSKLPYHGICGAIGDVIQEYLTCTTLASRACGRMVVEWWAGVCSSIMSVVVSLVDVDSGLAEWMFALLLSLSRVIHVNHDDTIVPLIFGTTFIAMSDVCHHMPMVWYGLVRAGIQNIISDKGDDASMSGSVLFACLSAIVVSLPKNTGVEYRAIIREVWYDYSRHVVDTDDAVACGLALHHVYNGSLHDTRDSSLCILRASISLLTGTSRETLRMTVPRHMLDILARNPPLSMQIWVLEEMRLHSMQMYTDTQLEEQKYRDVFDFAMSVVDRSTRRMTVLHTSAPTLIIDIMSFLNPWRPQESPLFKLCVLRLIEILEKNPEYAQPIIRSSLWDTWVDAPCTARQASRIHLVLSILLPCCHRLEPLLITEYLAPCTLSLLRHAWAHVSLAFVINDMCCSILSHPGLHPDHVHTIASTYITTYLEVLRHHDTPSLLEYFATGFVTIIRCCPDSSITNLDSVLDACSGLANNPRVLFGVVQAAAYSLDIVPLRSLPTACSRFKQLFGILQNISSDAYHGCRGHVLKVIQSSHDITRLPYLAEQFSDMVHAV